MIQKCIAFLRGTKNSYIFESNNTSNTILLLYSKIDTSLWTVITDYFYIFRQWTSLPSIYQIFLHTWIAIKIHPALYPAVCWLTREMSRCGDRSVSKRNLYTIFTRRMIEGKKKRKKRGRSRIYNNNERFLSARTPRVTAKVPS